MKITCVVDNAVEHASSLWGEHGLAFVVEVGDRKILFDTGQSGTVLLHNLERLRMEPRTFAAIAVSHGHADHTGGLIPFLKRAPGLPLVAHPDFRTKRFAARKKKDPRLIGPAGKGKEIRKLAKLRLDAGMVEILPDLWTTGEIRKRPHPEGRSPRHLIRLRDGSYVRDLYRDDLSLVWKGDDGLVVILGCAHAGVLNILAQVAADFQRPIKAVVGGMHLHGAEPAQLEHIVGALAETYDGLSAYPNHCTGIDGFLALQSKLGGRVKPCPVGTVLEF